MLTQPEGQTTDYQAINQPTDQPLSTKLEHNRRKINHRFNYLLGLLKK
jgi:hypothetical protein